MTLPKCCVRNLGKQPRYPRCYCSQPKLCGCDGRTCRCEACVEMRYERRHA